MARYWVIGGRYEDTTFERIIGGGAESRFGPFDTYDAAKEAWATHAWQSVDDAHARFRIEQESEAATIAGASYWVVGGRYKDTHFEAIMGGGEESWIGPFDTFEAARDEWARLAWQSVDDALSRYRIEKRYSDS